MNQQIIWTPGVTLEDIQRQVIVKALQFYKQDKAQTAISLQMTPKALEKKLEQYEKEQREHEMRREEVRKKEADFRLRARGMGGRLIPG